MFKDIKNDREVRYVLAIVLILMVLLLLFNPLASTISIIIAVGLIALQDKHPNGLPRAVDLIVNNLNHHYYLSIIIMGLIAILGILNPVLIFMLFLIISIFYLGCPFSVDDTVSIINKYANQNNKAYFYIMAGLVIIGGLVVIDVVIDPIIYLI